MAVTVKHKGFGRFYVQRDGVDIAGPMGKAEADERAAVAVLELPPAPVNGNKDYLRRLSAEIKKPLTEEAAEIKAVLLKRRDERTVSAMMRDIEPVLRAGKSGVHRRRYHTVIPARPAVTA